MQDLALLRMAGALAQHSSARHRLVSENIANSDTPGYRARDLEAFALRRSPGLALRETRPGHLPDTERAVFESRLSTAPGAASPNGNDVALDDQMARAANALHDHGKAVAVYGKTLSILRAGLGRR